MQAMRWHQLAWSCRLYLGLVYLVALPFTIACFSAPANYPYVWFLLTLVSLFVSTINVRLPKISSVISMGDVFTILALTQFGPGPALITYWLDIIAGHFADVTRQLGIKGIAKIMFYRFAFNVSCCAISVWFMWKAYTLAMTSGLPSPVNEVLALAGIACTWFLSNTLTLSVAVSFWTNQRFMTIWKEGLVLYLLNFSGSAAAAGLISIFYERVSFVVLLLCIPIAVVLYQLYLFYIEKFEQAQKHIAQLNKLFLQTVEAMATAVDAKDPYTHGHIRRVQVYAVTLAKCMGISDRDRLMAIEAGALLHDIGKIAIPEYILNKPTALTATEFEKMKLHPIVGASMLKGVDFPYPVEPFVKSHHERWDGKGYPEGLSGESIPIGARILSLVDCYDALTTTRPYRTPMPKQQLIEFFQREAGRSYDPQVVEALLTNLGALEEAVAQAKVHSTDFWGVDSSKTLKPSSRPLEHVQPTVTYNRALSGSAESQHELYSAFEFARAEGLGFSTNDVLTFMGGKLMRLIPFDAGVFYVADLEKGYLSPKYIVGTETTHLNAVTVRLEQKLSGWVAANNQSLWDALIPNHNSRIHASFR
jgi:putative nucleotidyltransferase with HDIG domain